MLIEKHVLRDVLGDGGWHSLGCVRFKHFSSPVTVKDINVILHYLPGEVGVSVVYQNTIHMHMCIYACTDIHLITRVH